MVKRYVFDGRRRRRRQASHRVARQIALSVEPSLDDGAREPIGLLFGEAISWGCLPMHSSKVVINQVDVSARDLD
jgi:hypothetical protein